MKRIALLIPLAFIAVGCAPDAAMIEAADMFANETVGPEYVSYVSADGSLTEAEKRVRLENVASFRAAVVEAQSGGLK